MCFNECIYHLHLRPFSVNNQHDFKGGVKNQRIVLHYKTIFWQWPSPKLKMVPARLMMNEFHTMEY